MTRPAPLVHFNGRILPPEQALVSALSPALSHGPIAYETMRASWNKDERQLFVFRMNDHLRRLAASMRILRFEEAFSIDDIGGRVLELARANAFNEDVHFRLQVFPERRDERREVPTQSGVLIVAEPRPETPARSATCKTSGWRRPSDDSQPSRVKAVGMRMFARVAMAEARADGYDQAILLNDRGRIAEGVSSNIFLIRFGAAITPARSASILEGVTRATLMHLLQEEAIACEEREVDRSELYDSDEAFLCSTGLGILPIASVDRLTVGDGTAGPLTKKLRARYESVLRSARPGGPRWLTPVYT